MPPSRRLSSVPAAEDALLERLIARDSLDSAHVILGLPASAPTKRERIYIVGVEDNDRQLITQQGARRESYVLPVLVEVHSTGPDRSKARGRFWEIVEEIEQELASDPELADVCEDSALERIVSATVLPMKGGWIAQGTLHIRVNAII